MSPKLSGTVLCDGAVHSFGGTEVTPSISVSTTFKASYPEGDNVDVKNTKRHVIEYRLHDGHANAYASDLSDAYAALVFFKPKRIAINGGYFGCHATEEPDDLCWLETPLNPRGESRDIIHKAGGELLVDSTFAPSPLQYPFKWGAYWYVILHSATRYFGGHSDLLGGVLAVKTLDEWTTLQHDRTYLGNVLGSLEAWSLLRSLRTLHLRVPRQSDAATVRAKWLQSAAQRTPAGQTFDGVPGRLVTRVWHSSLQTTGEGGSQSKHQLEDGWNRTFAIQVLSGNSEQAIQLPQVLLSVATRSFGGIESLIECRTRADVKEDPRLIRISVGVEDVEDLKDGLRIGLQKVASIESKLQPPIVRLNYGRIFYGIFEQTILT
ncbi:Cys/Met metabolism PLP-dependent enzyme-domain-containing protein [Armillaria novae-zelandiae]|uniref:Cys/Met metabolism PLP-dependent enzyme-domain-containing protein n=1 Tax=Armillaria novae-zelandiae TaxID=153914 RepID=A0AA39PV41_9AGAR|nr:Cys/Met metabolism PLP-dependent enzyme-domain-containing protein [Armillaria novae-zelandiae]